MNALTSTLRHALIALFPAGGQRRARRNAWAAMVADTGRARDRQEASRWLGAAAPPAARSA